MTIDERRAKSTAWALTFADVLALLLTFFVLLLVMLSDAEKRLSTLIEQLLDETYEEMTMGLSYDNISVDRETKGIKITITGTNGKSTTCKMLFNIFKTNKFDVRLVGNIGKIAIFIKSKEQTDNEKFDNS